MNWFTAPSVVAFALGLILGHWLPRLAWTWREKKRLQRRLAKLKGGKSITDINSHRRGT